MSEKELADALLKLDMSKTPDAADVRQLTRNVLERDRRRVRLWTVLTVLSWFAAANTDEKYVIGYFTNWSQHRIAGGRYSFLPEDIDPTKYTHAIYTFAVINQFDNVDLPEWNDAELIE